MNARQLRLVVGFLSVFVLISVAPRIGGLEAGIPSDLGPDELGELLLVGAAGILLSVGCIAARRRWPAAVRGEWWSRAIARIADRRVSRTPKPLDALSPITRKLRAASDAGIRVPELARKFGLSQDAVRNALGRSPSAPAARPGSSFRHRKPGSSAVAVARSVAPRRTAYQVSG